MRRRASAMLYVLILITIMGLVSAAYLNVANAAYKTETSRERTYAAHNALQSAILAMTVDYANGVVSLSSTPTYYPFGAVVSLSMVDNTNNVTRTMIANATTTYKSQVFSMSQVVGKRYANPVPNTYALFVNSSLTGSSSVTTNSSITEGAIYVNGTLSSSSSVNVAGDLEYTGASAGTVATTGETYPNATVVNFPTVNLSNYTLVGQLLNILGSLLGINLGSSYGTQFYSAFLNPTMGGTITGQGSIAGGSMDVTSNLVYAGSSTVAAFIMSNTITVESTANRIDGFYFCNGTFITHGPVTINGSLACQSMSLGGPLTINYDSRIWTTESLSKSLRLPGAYP